MWMMMDSNNDDGRELKPPADPMIGRKLRPLMPRPMSNRSSPYSTPSCCCCVIQNPKILSWNHSISDYGVNVKRERHAAPLVSTRWNPTPEQLQALEEMYRRGIRTPSAEQIQQIAAKLGRFGKIEGKNVFYWFQNHKARERQKKRRQLELLAGNKTNNNAPSNSKQTPGLRKRYFEIEHHKKVSIPSNCSIPSEDSASMHTAAIGKDGWQQFNYKELHNNFTTATVRNGNETTFCQLHLDLSSCSLPLPNLPPNTNNSSTIAITSHKPTGQENTNPYSTLLNLITNDNDDNHHHHQAKENQTLQLFPTASNAPTTATPHTLSIRTQITPPTVDFIEFLPIKN